MTPKRDPSDGEIGGRGSPARACADEDGDAGRRNSAAEVLAAKEQEIEKMRRRLKELEELDREILPAASASHEEEPESAVESATTPEKAEVDARSIYVGNVDYACLPEDVQQHFHFCGTINRVTILTDSFGRPKGFAYVEFAEAVAVQKALLLNETELYGRPLKVSPKRTNIPGMKPSRGRHPSPFHSAYRKVPRFRRFLGYNPYY